MKWRSTAIATTVLLALSLIFGLVMAANAVTPTEKSAADEYRAKAAEKVARLSNSRITQEQREAAAAQMKLMKALSAVGSDNASSKATAPGVQSVVAAASRRRAPVECRTTSARPPTGPTARCSASSSTSCPVSVLTPRTTWASSSGWASPIRRPIPARTTTRSSCVSSPSRCTPICPRRHCAATCRSTRGPTQTAPTPSTRTRSATSGRSSSRTRTAPCASSSPTSCRSARRATCSSPSTKASWAPARALSRARSTPRTAPRSTSTAASPRGSATVRRTSGSRPPRRSLRIRSA